MTKILVTRNWPSGYICWLVSIISVLGIFNLLLINPEKQRSENRWITAYAKYYYIFILPLLGLLFTAVGKRVTVYGVTEPRYFLILLGGLLAGLSIYFIFSNKKSIKVIPISLFVIAVISLWGPGSAYNISLYAQKSRAKKIMEKYDLLVGTSTRPATVSVDEKDEMELSSIFDYIILNHGANSISEWFPKPILMDLDKNKLSTLNTIGRDAHDLMDHLGLKYKDKWNRQRKKTFYFTSEIEKAPFNITNMVLSSAKHLGLNVAKVRLKR